MLLLLSTILSVSRCSRVRFDPDAYRASSSLEAIVNENGLEVMCHEPKFDEFACMHKTKWEELRRLIQGSKLNKKAKAHLLNTILKFHK